MGAHAAAAAYHAIGDGRWERPELEADRSATSGRPVRIAAND
jgi:hypothetical protein